MRPSYALFFVDPLRSSSPYAFLGAALDAPADLVVDAVEEAVKLTDQVAGSELLSGEALDATGRDGTLPGGTPPWPSIPSRSRVSWTSCPYVASRARHLAVSGGSVGSMSVAAVRETMR